MKNTKHTQGPWYWEQDQYLFGNDRQFEVLNGTIYNKADARLIAAAPELLEALESVEPIVSECFKNQVELNYGEVSEHTKGKLVNLRNAIRKAKGDS